MKTTSALVSAYFILSIGITGSILGCSGADPAENPPPATTATGGEAPGGTGPGGSAPGGGGGTAMGGSGGNVPAGGTGGQGVAGSGGAGGDGGGATKGRPGTAVVAGGGLCKSPNFIVWFAMGESPGGTGVAATSPNYSHIGGVTATTQP